MRPSRAVAATLAVSLSLGATCGQKGEPSGSATSPPVPGQTMLHPESAAFSAAKTDSFQIAAAKSALVWRAADSIERPNLYAKNAPGAPAGAPANPLPVYLVRLDSLTKYQLGIDPATLLMQACKTIVPMTAGETVRSTQTFNSCPLDTLSRQQNEIDPGSLGSALTAASAVNATKATQFIVEIPALHGLRFIGFKNDAGLQLIPLQDHPSSGFVSGKSIRADSAFAGLVKEATKVNPGRPI